MTPMRILIVDDNRTNLEFLRRLVDTLGSFETVAFTQSRYVVDNVRDLEFDIAILDFQMPDYDGVALMKILMSFDKNKDKPFIIVTADTDVDVRLAALSAGAIDFLNKPINSVEFIARMKNIAALTDARNKLADQAAWLRCEVENAVMQLREREQEIIDRLTLAAGYKDPETARHTMRVAAYSEAIALSVGLDAATASEIRRAAPMHDIGKVAVSDAILLKQGKLTPDEHLEMQRHALVGADILSGSQCTLLKLASEIAGGHHERWDGTGYPYGAKAEGIPMSARIVAVADTFDALTTARPYKEAWSIERACDLIVESAGTHFDPACVDAFLSALPKLREIIAMEALKALSSVAA